MDYYVWDKKSNLIGMSAMTIMNSRPDFKHDDVIVIHKKGEPENIVMVETKNELLVEWYSYVEGGSFFNSNVDLIGGEGVYVNEEGLLYVYSGSFYPGEDIEFGLH